MYSPYFLYGPPLPPPYCKNYCCCDGCKEPLQAMENWTPWNTTDIIIPLSCPGQKMLQRSKNSFKNENWRYSGLVVSVPASRSPVLGSNLGPEPPHRVIWGVAIGLGIRSFAHLLFSLSLKIAKLRSDREWFTQVTHHKGANTSKSLRSLLTKERLWAIRSLKRAIRSKNFK